MSAKAARELIWRRLTVSGVLVNMMLLPVTASTSRDRQRMPNAAKYIVGAFTSRSFGLDAPGHRSDSEFPLALRVEHDTLVKMDPTTHDKQQTMHPSRRRIPGRIRAFRRVLRMKGGAA